MSDRERPRLPGRPAAIAFLISSLAILAFFSDRFYFGDRAHILVQSILLIIAVVAIVAATTLGTLAFRKAGQLRRNISFILAGVVLAGAVFTVVFVIGSRR